MLTDPSPLVNSPEREAVDSMRGYSYQILRSIEAWVDLADGAVLALEGAEDFDRLEETEPASIEQIKDTAGSGNVTLRSQSVLDAIGNFWGHLGRNPGTPIQFRFLTTSGIGREKKRPFGFDAPGLEAWQAIRAAPTDKASLEAAAAIATFLVQQESLPEAFRRWIEKAPTAEFIARIVVPMEWVTGWPDWRDLYGTVLAKLVELGETRNIGSADAAAALSALHTEAWKIATSKGPRLLRRGDLLRIFDEAGTTAVPNSQLLAMIGALTGTASSGSIVPVAPEPFALPPRPAPRGHPRPELEARIGTALAQGTVLIHGGTGMGKTALALTTTDAARPCTWLDMREMPVAAAAARIDAIAQRLSQGAQLYDVVLDDLPAAGDARALEGPLGRLREVLDRLGGTLLVTSADHLPPRLAAQLLLDPSRTFPAPSFEIEDVLAYLRANECPEDSADAWSKIIHASSTGHPQLVDARIAALVQDGFPHPDMNEFLTVRPEIVDVRSEARRLVAERGGDERELLARASLLLGRTSRKRLMAVAQISPVIAEPGHVIDRLTGPWLERMDHDDLRSSPLLRNLGVDTRGADWAASMNRGIAFSFLKNRSLFASDIFELATHAMLGGTAAPLIPVLPGLLQANEDVWAQVAETASMLTFIGVGDASLPFQDPIHTAAFRVLQLRIALEGEDEARVSPIVEAALREFDAADPGVIPGPGLFEAVFLWQFLQKAKTPTLAQRLTLSIRFVKTGARIARTLEEMTPPEDVDPSEMRWPDLSAFVPMTLIPAISDVDGLNALLDLVADLGQDDRGVALGGYAADSEAAALALDRVWLGEAQRSEPRWAGLADTLQRIQALAGELAMPSLSAAAAPLLVRVIDENLKDPDKALATADSIIAEQGRPARVLGAKARVLWRRDRPSEAVSLYEEALTDYPLGLSWKTDILRDAAMAAGKAGDWPLAARRMTEALASLSEEEPLVRHVGFLFDLAAALQLSGRRREAVNRLGNAVDLLIADGQDMPPEPLLSVRQLGSQVIKSIAAESGGRGPFDDSEMALTRLFGSPSGMEELTWGDQRPAPLDVVALIMAELDVLMPEFPEIGLRMAQRLRVSHDLLAQSAQGDVLTKLAVRTLDVTEGGADAIREVRAIAFAAAQRDDGQEVADVDFAAAPLALSPQWQELVKYRLLARVVAMVAAGKTAAIPVAAWRSALNQDGMADVAAMVDGLGRMIEGTEDAVPRVFGGNTSWNDQLLAALLAPIQRRVTPDQLLVCHAVAASYLNRAKLGEFCALPFSAMVTEAWLDRCDSPAQLVTPRLTVPAIRKATTSTPPGWPRVLAVLEEARHAVSRDAASSVSEALQALRDAVGGPAAA
ncbi:MAG TPA: tetratricopeptide repeat protein [Novosphingobium sp.]